MSIVIPGWASAQTNQPAQASQTIQPSQDATPPSPGSSPQTTPADQSNASAANVARTEDIVVTGSRIDRAGFSSPTPVTVIGAGEIERRAAVNVAQVLDDIPALRPSSTNTTANFSAGGAGANFADLRGLGTNRTLVLVDSRRFTPSALTGQVNLNLIPTLMIDRVETVTGGASAAYGSDAVAGVVNVILRKQYTGVQLVAQGGFSDRGDDYERRFGGIAGVNFAGGRGHIVAGVDYVKNEGVGDVYTRDWGRNEYGNIVNPTPGASGPARIIASNVHFATMARGGIITSGPLAGTAFGPGGTSYQWNYGQRYGSSQIGGDGYGVTNYTYQPLSPPFENVNALVRGSYDLSDAISFNTELSYGRSHSETYNGPSRDQANLTVQPDNAFIPADIQARRVALGVAGTSFTMGRYEDDVQIAHPVSTTQTWRALAGLEGKIGSSWTWNANYQYGRSIFDLDVYDNRINANFTRAIDAVRVSAANVGTSGLAIGTIACRSTLTAPTNGCVPLNIFGIGSPSAAARAYVTGTETYHLAVTEQNATLNLQGKLFSTWAGPVSLAVGAEYRRDSAAATSDAISQASGFQVGNPKPFNGSLDVKEIYAETVVPLAKDTPFLQSLELNGAVRRTDYSTSGAVTTWKAGLSWEPVNDVRVRATRSRDIRAPNLSELFSPVLAGQTQVINPPTGQQIFVRSLTGGNPNLKAEIGDTWTAGLIYEPHWFPRLRASVDYYDIKLKNAVSSVAGAALVAGCAQGRQDYCSLVTFDAGGNVTQVSVLNLNLAQLRTSGVDTEISYRLPFASLGHQGGLTLRALGTWVTHLTTVDATGSTDQAGAFGNNIAPVGVPRFTGNLLLIYDTGPLSISGQARHFSGGKYSQLYIGPQDAGYTPTAANSISDNRVPGATYINTTVQYDVGKAGGPPIQIFATVNNLFDKDPPISPSANGTNPVNTVYYDVIGRTYRFGVRLKL